MFLSCRSIPLRSIQASEKWNLHPWESGQVFPELTQSFREIGVLSPLTVRDEAKDQFSVIDGFKRLQFFKNELKPNQLNCTVVDSEAPYTYILDLILAGRCNGVPFSLAEKAQFVEIASRFLSPEEVQQKYLPSLGLKKNPSTMSMLSRLLIEDEMIIREIHEGRLREKMVTEILNLQEGDRIALVHLFCQLKMGEGKQKRFFKLIRDNAYRVDLSIKSYLNTKEIQQILDHNALNIPQKINHLSTYLQRQLTPSLARAEEEFSQQVNALRLPDNHSITHSPSFEKDEVTLTIKFNSLTDCRKYLNHTP